VNARIDRLQRRSAEDRRVITLGGGLPSVMQFPRGALGAAFMRAIGEPAAGALQYGWPEGAEPLREWIAARLRARGADITAGDVIVTAGAQQAIAIAAELALDTGDRVRVSPASYPAALDLFRSRGAHPAAGGRDHQAAYVMPAVANPTGTSMSAEERTALLDEGIDIIEDDAYAVVPPPRMRARALRLKRDRDLQASSLGQDVLVKYLERADFDARLVRLRRFYRARAYRLARAAARFLPQCRFSVPEGGFSLWLESDSHADDTQLLQRAVELGVSFDPGRLFRPNGASRPLALRLCFSLEPAVRLEQGIHRLAAAFPEDLHAPTFGC
jgi:2-aminoadipate transaminase